jgi:hypothetical protein
MQRCESRVLWGFASVESNVVIWKLTVMLVVIVTQRALI